MADIAFIAYDIYDISQNGLSWESGLALGADVVGAVVPFASGGGVAVRAMMHADDAVDAVKVINKTDNSEDLTRIGRWMGGSEYDKMVSTGMAQESISGTTHVAHPASPHVFGKKAKPGSLYAEFDVPMSSVKSTSEGGVAKIIGPNSLEGKNAVRKGRPVPQMPPARNIEHLYTKGIDYE